MNSDKSAEAAEPIDTAARVQDLDVLRGVALFGVFLLNMLGFADAEVMATRLQLQSLPTARIDRVLYDTIDWLLLDKANTLFAFLFGLGFYLQMQRLEARGADFTRIYRRRLTVLLGMGVVHALFLWVWDILHLYALAGFALLAMRGIKTRSLLVGGVLLAMFGRVVHEALAEFAGLDAWHGLPLPFTDAAVLMRQAASAAGDYRGLFREFARLNLIDYLLNASIIGWFLYALGRFMLGAWVGRHGWLQRAADHLPGFRRIMWLTLPAGLALDGIARLIFVFAGRLPAWDHWIFLARALHLLAVPILATGYLCLVVVALHTPTGGRLLAPFAWPGRMALTNYVGQSLFFAFVLFGVGPGLDLAGRIGSSTVFVLVIAAYAAQMIFSRWWLSRFRHGPLEWVWRALTYGDWPRSTWPGIIP